MRLDADPALDPAAADPLVAQFRYALRRAFGADPSDATLGPAAVPLSVATRSWDRYSVLAYGNALGRSEEHTSELQSLMRISYAVLCLKKKIAHQAISYLHLHRPVNITHT